MKPEIARKIMAQTQEDYNLLADEYTRTRAFITPDIKQLGEYVKPGDRVLDSGCANGRLFELIKEKKAQYLGIDNSQSLLNNAKKNYPQAQFQLADALSLPFEDNSFDKVFSMSVLHHIPSKEFRLLYMQEALRVLKPQGLLVLRVWNMYVNKKAWDYIWRSAVKRIFGRSEIDIDDIYFPWKDQEGKVIANRYLHCFTDGELEQLAMQAGFKVIKVYKDQKEVKKKSDQAIANIYLVAQKP